MTIEQAVDTINRAYAQVVAENRELRRTAERLGQENNVLCDRVFELEQMLGMRRDAANE